MVNAKAIVAIIARPRTKVICFLIDHALLRLFMTAFAV